MIQEVMESTCKGQFTMVRPVAKKVGQKLKGEQRTCTELFLHYEPTTELKVVAKDVEKSTWERTHS